MGRGFFYVFGGIALLFAPSPVPSWAASTVVDQNTPIPNTGTPAEVFSVDVSEGKLLTLPGPAANVFIADPTIADIQIPTLTHVFIFGKKVGRTTLYAMGANGVQIARIEISVGNGSRPVANDVATDPRANGVSVKSANDGLVLDGIVPDAATAARINDQAAKLQRDTAGKIDDRLAVKSSVQVSLNVKIAEVDRSITKELGFNWQITNGTSSGVLGIATGRIATNNSATGSALIGNQITTKGDGSDTLVAQISGRNFLASSVIDALADEGLVTVLAEPNLIALSGETASFLAGGEFPVLIANSSSNTNSISVEFKPYGISLSFVPTVLAANRISLHVRPEVSELVTSGAGSINVNGYVIPGVTTRRADTTVELGSGESFAIAGLLKNNIQSDITKLPGLGDLPILGALFRSSSFQRDETELVIIVTPYIVKPVSDPRLLHLPTDYIKAPTDLEQLLYGHVIDASEPPARADQRSHLRGDAGFEIE